jgi:hypothetical protein
VLYPQWPTTTIDGVRDGASCPPNLTITSP